MYDDELNDDFDLFDDIDVTKAVSDAVYDASWMPEAVQDAQKLVEAGDDDETPKEKFQALVALLGDEIQGRFEVTTPSPFAYPPWSKLIEYALLSVDYDKIAQDVLDEFGIFEESFTAPKDSSQ